MIEMLGVLAIVCVLSVGGIVGYSKAMEKFKLHKLINQIATVAANVRTLYGIQTDYSGVNDLRYSSVIYPQEILDNRDTLVRYPENVDLYVSNKPKDSISQNNGFAININAYKMFKKSCIELLSYD